MMQREFYRSARGPAPGDEDVWSLVFDPASRQLVVRHVWESARHSGVDEFDLDGFLAEPGAAQDALIATLFAPVPADA